MKTLNVEIITPSKSAYKGECQSITLPGTIGNFQVLFNHAPLLSALEIGKIKIDESADKKVEFVTGGGTVEVRNNRILVLADSVESESEIDVDRAQLSYKRAKERLTTFNKKDVDEARAEAALHRAINRLKFVGAKL